MSVVVCKDLVKRFGEATVVDNVNIEVRDGEFMVFVGPSGCGKTTTLRMIGGLETVTSGEIYIDDQLVNNIAPRHRDIAMVFQNYALYPHYKVFDNIAYTLRLRKRPRDEIMRRVTDVATMLGIEHLLDRWPRQLSGGERQRVALGRAIVRNPRLYLMDEPLSNLDAKLRVQMRREIIRLQRQLGTTTIYVTHDQVEAMTMGDRIMVLRSGQIQQIGEPEVLYNQPANMFVAQFIGSPAMNIFPGRLEGSGGELTLVTDVGHFPLTPEFVARISPDPAGSYGPRDVVCGIRPEDIRLNGADLGSGQPQALVDLVEGLGSDAYVSLTIGEVMLLARTPSDSRPNEGEQVTLHLNLDKLHLFDPKSEVSIVTYR
ncbi:MAG: sn-glycerol-3-phosphate ABC transporter ATP-binding protein UgpC [Anaerolineae bacterium]